MKLINRYRNLPLQIKSVLWFTICNFLLKGLSFITVPLFAAYLSTEEYGAVSIYNSYQQILLIFATFELSIGAYARGTLKYKSRKKEFTSALLILCNIITAISFFIVLCFNKFYIRYTGMSLLVLILTYCYFWVQPSYNCWMYDMRFSYAYRPAVIVTIIQCLVSTLIPLYFVIYYSRTAETKIVITLMCLTFLCVPFYFKCVHFNVIKNFLFVKQIWTFCLTYQLPLVLHSLSYLILGQADRIMIGEMVGKSSAGIYSVAYSLASVITIFQSSVEQVLQPYRFQKLEEKNYKAIFVTTNQILIVFAVIILLFVVMAPEVIRLLFSQDYYEARWTIPAVSASVFFMFIYTCFVNVEAYFEKTKYVMAASSICAITNIILNYIGIKIYGYIVCGYTTLFSYILFAILHYFFLRRVLSEEKINEAPYDIKFILMTSIIFLALILGLVAIYDYFYVRIIIFSLIVFIAVINRKRLICLFRNINKKY